MKKQTRDSLVIGFAIVTGIATTCTVLGFSMKDAFPFNDLGTSLSVFIRMIILTAFYFLTSAVIWAYFRHKYNSSILLKVGENLVTIKIGDIFIEDAWRVIPVDTHIETTVDNIVISELSLQGKLINKYNDIDGVKRAAREKAAELSIAPVNGKYTFDLGTVIPYEINNEKYLLVVLTELNESFEARTTMVQYEITLMKMWDEISKCYAGENISLPILGNGLTRFNDGRDYTGNLLRCMLCTLNTSGVHYCSSIRIVIYQNQNEKRRLSLYEYKDVYSIEE